MTTAKTNTRTRAAFTLIELLVVIVIIGLLVTIVVPSIAAARTAAKVASCKALISTLETGVRLFRGEESLGRDYPPSLASATNATNGATLYGAHTLALAVLGHDLQGTRVNGWTTGTYDFATITPPTPDPRKGPFVDAAKLQVVRNLDFKNSSNAKVFSAAPDNAPLILDSFKMPILYYKANLANNGLLRYDRAHNQPVAQNTEFSETPNMWDNFNTGSSPWISDPRITSLGAPAGPYNPDSFLLISAGPDMKFGTGDDIANFGK